MRTEQEWNFRMVDAERRKEPLFRRFWIEEATLKDISEEEEVSRQAISDRLARRCIKTYSGYRYSPKGIRRWDFFEDTVFLTAEESRSDIEGTSEKSVVTRVGPVDTAKFLEDACSSRLEELRPDGLEVHSEAWEELREMADRSSSVPRLWKAVRHLWENWEEALDEDPLPRWVLARAMDALEMNQDEFSEILGFAPRTIRKWYNRGENVKPCTGNNRTQVRERLLEFIGSGTK